VLKIHNGPPIVKVREKYMSLNISVFLQKNLNFTYKMISISKISNFSGGQAFDQEIFTYWNWWEYHQTIDDSKLVYSLLKVYCSHLRNKNESSKDDDPLWIFFSKNHIIFNFIVFNKVFFVERYLDLSL
jgi:hypothetical protein